MHITLVTDRAVRQIEQVAGSPVKVTQIDPGTASITFTSDQLDRVARRLGMFDDAHVARHEWA